MRKRLVLLSACLFVVLAAFYFQSYHASSLVKSYRVNQNPSQDHSRFVSPYDQINLASQDALKRETELQVSGDEESIEKLYDSILASVSFNKFRLPVDAPIKNRLIRSELKFREGKHKRISEHDLVKAFNNVAEKLALPEYAKTYRAQVRMLRINTMSIIPTLIGKVDRNPNHAADRKIGAAIPSEMSPAESICIATILFQQKLYSDLYQSTPNEHKEKVSKLIENKKGRQQGPATFGVLDNQRHDEMRNRLKLIGRVNSTPRIDVYDVARKFLDDLGIEP